MSEKKLWINLSQDEMQTLAALQAEIRAMVEQAVSDNGVINITDVRGRQILVPVSTFSYIEIGPPEARRVGFGAE